MNTLFTQLPNIAKNLGGDSLVQQSFFYLKMLYFYIVTRLFRETYSFSISCQFMDRKFSFMMGSIVDIGVLEEIFAKQQYKWDLESSPTTILDLGAHGGETVIYYKILYPEARVFAVEPNPESFNRLEKNVAQFDGVTCIQAAVSDKNGQIDFFQAKSSLGHNIIKPRRSARGTISVQSMTLATIMAECDLQKLDLLKFDIEGAEELVFKSAQDMRFADQFIGEVHGDLMSATSADFLKVFASASSSNTTTPFTTPDRYFVQASFE